MDGPWHARCCRFAIMPRPQCLLTSSWGLLSTERFDAHMVRRQGIGQQVIKERLAAYEPGAPSSSASVISASEVSSHPNDRRPRRSGKDTELRTTGPC